MKKFNKLLATICLVTSLEGCVYNSNNLIVNSPQITESVEKSNNVLISELPKIFNDYFNEFNIPRRFVRGLNINFNPTIEVGETNYIEETRTIEIHPSLKVVDKYSMSGFSYQLGMHIYSNVFSEKEQRDFDKLVEVYEQRAYPSFIGLNLYDSSKTLETLEKCSFLEPLRAEGLSKRERAAEMIAYFFSNPYIETWNSSAIGEKRANAINSGRKRFLSEFQEFFDRNEFSNNKRNKPKLKDITFKLGK